MILKNDMEEPREFKIFTGFEGEIKIYSEIDKLLLIQRISVLEKKGLVTKDESLRLTEMIRSEDAENKELAGMIIDGKTDSVENKNPIYDWSILGEL